MVSVSSFKVNWRALIVETDQKSEDVRALLVGSLIHDLDHSLSCG